LIGKLNDREYESANACMFGFEHLIRGDFRQSVDWYSKAVADFDRERDKRFAIESGEHPFATSLSMGSWSQWLLGYPGKALDWVVRGNQIAEESTHSNSIALAKFSKAYLLLERGEVEEGRQCAEDLLDYAAEQVVTLFLAGGMVFKGACQAKQGNPAEGVALIVEGLRAWSEGGTHWNVPLFLSILAEAHLLAGQFDDGLCAIEEGLNLASESGHHVATSELYRVQGELVLASNRGNIEEVERAYRQALSVAREQEAKSYELRAAMSLARLWAEQGERRRAHDLLAPVYGWFTEGFDTRDLIDAKVLLGQLG
jgi:predicted ATPase